MTILEELLAQDLVQRVPPDVAMASQWMDDSGRHIEASEAIQRIDSIGAYVLAYDAARKAVASVMLVQGFRMRSRPGAHQALARFARHLSEQTGEPALRRFDRLRRNRNRAEYGSQTFGSAEVKGAIATARAIRSAVAGLR